MLGTNNLLRILLIIIGVFGASVAFGAGSVTITTPNNLALFQHTNGVANIPVTATATGVPSGGGVWLVLDGDTSRQVSSVRWNTPYSYTFKKVPLGEHTVEAYMIDSKGNLTGPSDIHPRVGVGDLIVCVGDSITAGEDDDITSDDWSADGRNGPHIDAVDGLSFGGFEPILNDLLTATNGYPCSVINEGLGQETTAGGLKRLPGLIAKYPTADTWLIAYGTNDIHVGISPSAYQSNLAAMISKIQSANPNAYVYMPKILYGGQPNIGTYLDYLGVLIYYTGNVLGGADMYTMFQNNLTKYNRMTAQAGTWYAVDSTPHPNGVGYQVIARLWEMALDYRVTLVADGAEPTVGRIWADKLQLTGANKIGLNSSNLLCVHIQPPTQPIPAGTNFATGGWSAILSLTRAADLSGGALTATVRLEPWDLSNAGVSSWANFYLSSGSTLLPTTRLVFPNYSPDEELIATVPHVGQLVPVTK